MGVWGSGNLDSDGALDAMAERSNELIGRVWGCFKKTSSAEADESEHWQLCLDMEWLFALERTALFSGWGLPGVQEFDEVMALWLDAWSNYFDGLSGPEFKAERKVVLTESIAEFRAICAKYEARRNAT